MHYIQAFVALLLCVAACYTDQPTYIAIDGSFDDWKNVRMYSDPDDQPDGTNWATYIDIGNLGSVLQDGVPDCHDTNHDQLNDIPSHVYNPNANILQYAYWIHEGGYYPTSGGYDVNFEVEGIMEYAPGNYTWYTEWTDWNRAGMSGGITPDEAQRCPDGPHVLPDGSVICFVRDMAPGPFQGRVKYAISEDGHEVELSVPFRSFLINTNGVQNLQLGQTIHASFSLETSGQYSTPAMWVSDTAYPIYGYVLESPSAASDWNALSIAFLVVAIAAVSLLVGGIITLAIQRRRNVHGTQETPLLDDHK